MGSNYDDLYAPDEDDPNAPRRGSGPGQRRAQQQDDTGSVPNIARPTKPIITGSINVPTNLYTYADKIAREIAQSAGVDVDTFRAVFFAIINQESGWNPNAKDNYNADGSKDRGIAQMSSGPQGAYDRSRGVTEQTQPGSPGWERSVYNPEFALRWAAQHLADLYGQVRGSGIERWRNAAAAYNGGLGGVQNAGPQAYADSVIGQAQSPAGIQGAPQVGYDAGGQSATDIPGLTHEQSIAAHRVADTNYIDIFGHLPTPAEYADILARGYTPQSLRDHLRAQPNPNAPGTTYGSLADLRALASQIAMDTVGYEPTEGEINFLIVNHVPVNQEHITAFYQQIRDHAVWASKRADGTTVNPDDWRQTRAMLQKVWSDLGLQGTVDATTVNDALGADPRNPHTPWTVGQARDHFRAQQAPGYPAGVTVGQVEQTANMVSRIKSDLFPDEAVTETELHQMQGMTPEQIRKLLRDRPSVNVPGITAGAERDARTLTDAFLKSAGIPGTEATPEDLRFLAQTGADPQAIAEYFSQKKDLVAKYPGLPYGLQSADYQSMLASYQDAIASILGPGRSLGAPQPGANKEQREQSLVGAALADRISGGDFASTVEAFRQKTGSVPTGSQFRQERVTPKQRSQPGAQPAFSQTPTGPTTQVEDPRQAPRAAVGGRSRA